MFSSVTDRDEPMGWILLILIFETVLYGFLAYYLDAVFPGRYGMARPWYFLCKVNINNFAWFHLFPHHSKRGNGKNFCNRKIKIQATKFIILQDNPFLRSIL